MSATAVVWINTGITLLMAGVCFYLNHELRRARRELARERDFLVKMSQGRAFYVGTVAPGQSFTFDVLPESVADVDQDGDTGSDQQASRAGLSYHVQPDELPTQITLNETTVYPVELAADGILEGIDAVRGDDDGFSAVQKVTIHENSLPSELNSTRVGATGPVTGPVARLEAHPQPSAAPGGATC